MKLKFISVVSITIIVFSLLIYHYNLPEWVYPITFLVIINTFLIFNYNRSKNRKPIIEKSLNNAEKNQLKELEIAKRVQTALLEVETPKIDGVNIAKRCIPANTLGGDFYTFISNSVQSVSNKKTLPGIIEYNNNQENILGMAIGDVAGHGVSSALVMALSFGILGKIGQRITSPKNVLKRANEDIRKFIINSQISHVTAIYSVFYPQTKTFIYASAGHNPALLIKKQDQTIKELYSQGAFLGMYPDETYEEHEIVLDEGDRIVLFTDGIIEPTNNEKEMYGESRLKKCLLEYSTQPIELLIDTVLDDVKRFSKKPTLKDDQTIIIIELT